MSYILQALRRSEQAQGAPESAPRPLAAPDLPDEPRRPLIWSAAALAVLALAGAAGYYFYFARGETVTVAVPPAPTLTRKQAEPAKAEPPASADAARPAEPGGGEKAPATAEPPPALKPSPFVEPPKRSEVRDLAEQLRVPPPAPAAKTAPALPRAPATRPEPVSPAPAPATPPVARADDGVKFLRAMPPEFQRELPALVVNIHIYSPTEADRILYINNRQYQVGDKVREDIRVEAIVEDGAVLSFRGQRFKLPRPS